MKDQDKTKEQLIAELVLMRQQIAELEALETERKRVEGEPKSSEERLKILFKYAKY